MNKSLLTLALGAFGIGITRYIMMGILPDIAHDLDVSISIAGHLISAYALGVVTGVPALIIIGGKLPQRSVLLGLMIWFTVFNALSAFASNYPTMLVARFLAGLPHGAYLALGTVAASELAVSGKSGRSIAIMFVGLTLANVFGVPLGVFISNEIGWRWTFGLVGLIGFSTIWCIKTWIPELPQEVRTITKHDLTIFSQPSSWLVIVTTIAGTAGFFAWYSYIAPLLTGAAGFQSEDIPFILMLAGLGMTFGNMLGGRLIDRYSTLNTILYFLVGMSLSLCLLSLVAGNQLMVLIMTFTIPVFAFSLFGSLRMIMIKIFRSSQVLGSTINQVAFNVANVLGALIGGWSIQFGFSQATPWIGAAMALAGAAIAGYMMIRRQRSRMPYYYFGPMNIRGKYGASK